MKKTNKSTLDIADELLFELKIKEHFEKGNIKYIFTKEQLVDFLREYNKLIFKVEDELQ